MIVSSNELTVQELDGGVRQLSLGTSDAPEVRYTLTPSSTVATEIAVEISGKRMDLLTADRLKKIGKRAKVDGFRPGKIPPHVLRSRYGAAARYEAIESAIDKAIGDVLRSDELNGTIHYTPPAFEGQIPESGGFQFNFVVERFPKIEVTDWKAIPVKVARVEVTDEEIDAEIEELRQAHSTLEPVEGRTTVAENDVLTVSYEPVDPEMPASLRAEDEQIELKAGLIVQTFIDGLVGAEIGEARELALDVPAGSGDERIAGKSVELRVTVTEIRTRELPAIDDELAKTVEKGETLAELRDSIRSAMAESREKESRSRARALVLQELNDRLAIELPVNFVKAQAIEEFKREVKQYFGDKDMDKMGLNWAELAGSKVPTVEASLRAELILLALSEAEAITISDEDLEEWFTKRAAEENAAVARVKSRFNAEARANLKMRLSMDRALDMLFDHADKTEVDASELQAEEEAAAADEAAKNVQAAVDAAQDDASTEEE
jgi:trigger factor